MIIVYSGVTGLRVLMKEGGREGQREREREIERMTVNYITCTV